MHARMADEKLKVWTEAVKELSESYGDLADAMRNSTEEVKRTKKLWQEKNTSALIKVGLVLIAFPDPISSIVGAAMVAAGAVQVGIRRRSIFVEDVPKTFQNTLKEVWSVREKL